MAIYAVLLERLILQGDKWKRNNIRIRRVKWILPYLIIGIANDPLKIFVLAPVFLGTLNHDVQRM